MNDAKDINGEEITLKMILEHMQYGFIRVSKRFDAMDLRIDILEKKMEKGFANLNDRLSWMESHDLPKRVSRLEDKVFAGIDS